MKSAARPFSVIISSSLLGVLAEHLRKSTVRRIYVVTQFIKKHKV